jgi:hypothetical protein
MTKYFLIGLNKTGTSSIRDALEVSMRFKPSLYIIRKIFKKLDFESKEIGYILNLTDALIKEYNFTIFKDRPWNTGCYKELKEKYTDAKFILTIRDQKEWWTSVQNWLSIKAVWTKDVDENNKNEILKSKIKEYNTHFNCETLNQNDYINYYNTYNNSVIEYFKDKPNFYLFYLNKDFNWINIQKIINLDEETIRNNIVKSLEERGWKFKKNFNLNGKIEDWEFLKSNKNKLT